MIKYYATLFLFLLLMGLWLMGAASSHQKHQESVFSHPNKISSFRIGKRRPLDANELAEFQALFNQGAFVYNIFYKNNKLPRKLCLFLMILASVVSVLRIVMLLVTGQ